MFFTACTVSKQERAENLFTTNCGSCHLTPSPKDLPKHLWRNIVLPEMGARMGIKDSTYSPFSGFSFKEQEAMMRTGVYNVEQIITNEDWASLKNYIIDLAPEQLEVSKSKDVVKGLLQFISKPVNIDSVKGSFITFLDIDSENGSITLADIRGNIVNYNASNNKVDYRDNYNAAISSYHERKSMSFVTLVGNLNPSELVKGEIYQRTGKGVDQVVINLHRPVHTEVLDLNNNGNQELLVSEFGNLTGELALHYIADDFLYKKKTLIGQPGIIRTIAKDMNRDGKTDIVMLSTQGNEGITILYQKNDLEFNTDQVLRFSPVYGSSWFELIDYNGDGYEDIITVNGDNADKTYVAKPYHGIRIFINDGTNNFEERYFYSLNGATRLVANDFDQDGDVDLGVISSFPDYEKSPQLSFVYLENIDSENYTFKTHIDEKTKFGRWLLMDADDIDKDGDDDIVLSSFTYSFTPVPNELSKLWSASDTDILILENTLY